MRPTFSILLFTVLSGAGYGLWFLTGVGLLAWWPRCDAATMLGDNASTVMLCVYPGAIEYALIAGFVFVSAGLLSSVAHLGKPLRAWRALSQWRSSWLSREGVLSLLTYLPAIALIGTDVAAVLQGDDAASRGWLDASRLRPPLGLMLTLGSVATVYCTANIYASLKPIRAWQNRWVVPTYFVLALHTGAILLWALASLPGATLDLETPMLLIAIAITSIATAALKRAYWIEIDRDPEPDAGRATGLDAQGRVRSFEQPHTEENYLTREMGFAIARKHAAKLRTFALLAICAVPFALAVAALALPALRGANAWPALVFALSGALVERWLFFAQARHAVIAYYAR